MVYPADPALPPLAEPPGCCATPLDVVITLTIDRGYLPDIPNLPEVRVVTGYSGSFFYFGDTYDYSLDPNTNTLTILCSTGGECFTGMTLVSTGAALLGPYPPAYNQADGCTLGTGFLNLTNVSVAAAP